MSWYKHIVKTLAVTILVLLSVAFAKGQGLTVYAEEPFTFEVDVQTAQEDNIIWEIYSDYTGINLAVVPGNCPLTSGEFVGGDNTGSSVSIVWHVPGIYLVKVRAINDCPTDNMEVYLVQVLEALPTAVLMEPEPICFGDAGVLEVHLDGDAPFSLTLFDGVNYTTYTGITDSIYYIVVNPVTTTTYTITQVIDIDGSTNNTPSNSVTLIVNPLPTGSQIYKYDP